MTTTQRHEIEAWLGHDTGWTTEQVDQIVDAYLRAQPDTPDDEREALLTAIAQRIDGALDRAQLLRDDTAAQVHAEETRKLLRSAVRADVAAGMSEYTAAETYGVSRMTIRAWLGKR